MLNWNLIAGQLTVQKCKNSNPLYPRVSIVKFYVLNRFIWIQLGASAGARSTKVDNGVKLLWFLKGTSLGAEGLAHGRRYRSFVLLVQDIEE